MSDGAEAAAVGDPFLAEDPKAIERERRRLQREARRQSRSSGRKSLSDRVSGVIDGAAGKGREALEQTKDRARNREAPPDAPEPPPFRRPRPEPAALDDDPIERFADAATEAPAPEAPEPAAPEAPDSTAPPAVPADPSPAAPTDPADAAAARRFSAEELMPRRRGRPAAADPEPAGSQPGSPGGEDLDWFADADADADGAPPPPIPPQRREVATGDYPPLPPPTTPPDRDKTVFFRRLIAVALVLLVAIAAYGLLTRGGGDEAPAPKGPATLKTESVTIPEGYTRSQIADVAKEAGLKGDYEKATAKAPRASTSPRRARPRTPSLEGFLFPATYELEKGANVDDARQGPAQRVRRQHPEVDLGTRRRRT